MKKVVVVLGAAAVLAVIVGVRSVNGADDVRAQIEAANRGFEAAFAKGDAAGVAACYTANGQILPPGAEPMTETQAIQAYWAGALQSGAASVTLKTVEVEQHGDTAIEVGAAEILDANKGRLDAGKYIVVWKREGGTWKLHRDIWNSNLAPQ